ncbi:MAG: phospholipase D/Transphosphatidylase, partial [Burkholderiales bacterium]|nr:phospholipase D/Transphosphatidylase [Burkholderiales bacterium]
MKPAWGKIAAIALGVGALAAAWRFTPLKELATPENVLGLARAVREVWWAPFAVVAAYVVGALVLFPRPVITLVTIITFGVWLGLAYAVAGVLTAALVTYYAGRLLKRETVRRLAGDRFEKASKPVKRHGVIAVFAANMLPTPPFAVQNMMAGAIRVPVLHFAAGTLLSIIPTAIAWAVFGDQLTAALDDESEVSWGMIAAAIAGL